MENITRLTPLKQPIVFELEGFDVPPGYGTLFFILALFDFIVVLLGNGVVATVIIIDKNLHRPMFVLLCHLIACDLLGATAVLPRLMMHFLMGQKKITYTSAIAQAFCAHTYGAAMYTILGVMAYDRYVAVCEPLRYPTIVTSARLHTSCALAWIVALVLVSILFSFHINVPLCGTTIKDVFSGNRPILRLACGPTPINDIYGLTMSWCVITSVFLIMALSYFKILHASVKQRRVNSINSNNKALKTCAPQVAAYVIYQVATVVMILTHRFPSLSQNIKKFVSILIFIVPSTINPVIYGLVSKELRASIIQHFKKQISHKE